MTSEGGYVALVVDDDPLVRMTAAGLLAEADMVVLEAGSAGEALAILALAPRVDILFTDVRMPGGQDGVELAAAAVMARPGLKVVITSGYSGYEASGASPIRGVTFLPKPYTAAALVDTILGELRDGADEQYGRGSSASDDELQE